ncbi:putative Beta-lactamase [Bradyrhizobium sp. ORS 285]|uniref:serine hydrolase domain-containing protein n=1 Tax=Bradyrhizobium sp. ORS 285 TaxID=115808 RepID=UPI0002406248|nr:serine hydrolase [Bradyrhizobium sp. ORS 285]CCD88384.1 putative Beta-lactamase [Bradyrhizobium sp. ORS 285]SMX56867.1 putative Beta-lactamase [Bradyrhizobium sp. ORS 285]
MARLKTGLWLLSALLVAPLFTGAALAEDTGLARFPQPDWSTATPEDEGMDSAALAKLVAMGKAMRFDSLLITRHGKIVLDASYAPYNADEPHIINSSTKAVVSTLIAMLLKDGVLDSLDHPVLDFFKDLKIENVDARKQALTVQHLLNMTSGFDWDEGYDGGAETSLYEMGRSPDWVQYVLDRPMAHAPGETFYYNSGNSHLLSAIVTKLTGKSAEDFAKERLFGPLGITEHPWFKDSKGISAGGFGLALKPRDMAKIGYLYLRRGRWGEQQLLPPGWIEAVNHATVSMNAKFDPGLSYADQFWALPDKHVFMAVGYHCQVIMVLPDRDIVAVMTAREFCPFRKLANTIAATATSDSALPPAPEAAAALAAAVREVGTETQGPVGTVPEIAASISGKTYSFPPGPLGVNNIKLDLTGPEPQVTWDIPSRDRAGATVHLQSPIGLDGLYRKTTPPHPWKPFSYRAMKGSWIDATTFVIDAQFIGQGEERNWRLSFDGDKVTFRTKGRYGKDVAVEGHVAP